MRFPDGLPEGLTTQQIRGHEGVRVRETYARLSKETGIPWRGRNYDRTDWGASDPVNRALSAANAALYGVCHAAIVATGFSAGLGFLHVGNIVLTILSGGYARPGCANRGLQLLARGDKRSRIFGQYIPGREG